MTEKKFIAELRALIPEGGAEASLQAIARADEAVLAFPNSAALWSLRGTLIELGPELSPHLSDAALGSYQRSIELDPQFAEGWKKIGNFFRTVLHDEATAQTYFDEAKRLGG